jgi:hypothetical protein
MTRIGHMPMPLAPESPTGFPEQYFHRERRAGDKLLDSMGCDPADAVDLATVEPESEVVELSLRVFRVDRAGMRTGQPARQQGHASQAIALLPLGRRVHEPVDHSLLAVVGLGEAQTRVGFGRDEHHRFSPALARNQSSIDLNGLGERLMLQANQCGSHLVQTLSASSHGACLSLDLALDYRMHTEYWSVRRARNCAL